MFILNQFLLKRRIAATLHLLQVHRGPQDRQPARQPHDWPDVWAEGLVQGGPGAVRAEPGQVPGLCADREKQSVQRHTDTQGVREVQLSAGPMGCSCLLAGEDGGDEKGWRGFLLLLIPQLAVPPAPAGRLEH